MTSLLHIRRVNISPDPESNRASLSFVVSGRNFDTRANVLDLPPLPLSLTHSLTHSFSYRCVRTVKRGTRSVDFGISFLLTPWTRDVCA